MPPYLDDGRPLGFADGARSIDWGMAEEMAQAGIEFGSHTLTHRALPDLGDEELAQELLDSRRAIQERLGACDALAYPFGAWDRRVEAAAARAGYAFGFTLPDGTQRRAGPLTIPRIDVDDRDRGRRFALKLSPVARRVLFSPAKSVLRRSARIRG
jgi:peptidoglycan/xylan/chitin deacetylase (PgdA/CDA1 family)